MITITKENIKITPTPNKDIPRGLRLKVPKTETDYQTDEMFADINQGQSEYELPDGIEPEDITKAWIL